MPMLCDDNHYGSSSVGKQRSILTIANRLLLILSNLSITYANTVTLSGLANQCGARLRSGTFRGAFKTISVSLFIHTRIFIL